ncbi:2OG-Fe(II) oxygenase [Lentzea sp.]|uniref:2OG-Fe(II) oxygenase n=1 Tax=Lentzea sp. TaxID=56099 RepID=UPI002BAEB16C|nr:2OG-Fe(II) oxygenase [Lentzea sp.]HUQ56467.1 2OG-Fe(II) oxygenase [Lentzea sp.]
MLDLSGAALRETPFRHAVFDEAVLLSRDEVTELVESFPGTGLLDTFRRTEGSDKTYSANMATLHDHRGWSDKVPRMASCWRDLLSRLVDSDYAQRLGGLLGVPPGPVTLELRLTEYTEGGWMSRHTDRPDKLFSQNLYFCPQWSRACGGGLALYADEHDDQPVSVFVPGAGTSLAFARSDRSWHEVLPVSASAPSPRRALLVHGYRPDHERNPRC